MTFKRQQKRNRTRQVVHGRSVLPDLVAHVKTFIALCQAQFSGDQRHLTVERGHISLREGAVLDNIVTLQVLKILF